MRRLTASAVLVLCLIAAVSASAANRERVNEVWRSRYGRMLPTGPESVDQRDGSVWMTEGATVTHTARDGHLLGRTRALLKPCSTAANPVDGTCWVAQRPPGELTHVASDGTVLSTTAGLAGVARIAISAYDNSVWVIGSADWPASEPTPYLAHVSTGGHELSRVPDFVAVVVDPADGSAWACSDTATVRLRPDGTQAWTAPAAGAAIDEDPRDGSVWVASQDPATFAAVLTHLSWSGLVLSQTSGPAAAPTEVHVSHTDRSVWVTCSLTDTTPLDYEGAGRDVYSPIVLRFDPSGAEVARLDYASVQACNDRDGSVWVYQLRDAEWELVQYSAEMQEIRHFTPRESSLGWRAYDQTENTFWATADLSETGNAQWQFQRLGPDGTVLWHERVSGLNAVPPGLDPRDGSIWAEDPSVPGALVHYSSQGVELEWRPLPEGVWGHVGALLISPTDGSWWITAWDSMEHVSRLYHLGADGTLLSSFTDFGWPAMLDERDGSVWGTWGTRTGDASSGYQYQYFVHHLAADGAELLTKEYAHPIRIAGVATDGSVWVLLEPYPDLEAARLEHLSTSGEVLASVVPALPPFCGLVLPTDGSLYVSAGYLATGTGDGWVGKMASDGSVLWVHEGFWCPRILLNPDDGSLWAVDLGNLAVCSEGGDVVHYAADGTERWRGQVFAEPWPAALDRRDGSVWIADSMNAQLVHLVPKRSPFTDVPEDHWAFDEIVTCFEADIVMGFGNDTYRPALPVTRDAMAVYVARAVAGGDANVPTGPAEATFADVPNTGYGEGGTAPYWAYQHIEYCVDLNIVQGYDATHYRPSLEVDRGQMAVYIARTLVVPTGDAAIPEPPIGPTFHDVTAENAWAWCYRQVEYCVAQGVVQGYSPGIYRPEAIITRDQMAVYIQRAFELPT